MAVFSTTATARSEATSRLATKPGSRCEGVYQRLRSGGRGWRRRGSAAAGPAGAAAGAALTTFVTLCTRTATGSASGRGGRTTAADGPAVERVVNSLGRGTQGNAGHATFIDYSGKGLVLEDPDGIAGAQVYAVASETWRTLTVPSSTLTRVVASSSSTTTSKTVPRTEITAVCVVTRCGLGPFLCSM